MFFPTIPMLKHRDFVKSKFSSPESSQNPGLTVLAIFIYLREHSQTSDFGCEGGGI